MWICLSLLINHETKRWRSSSDYLNNPWICACTLRFCPCGRTVRRGLGLNSALRLLCHAPALSWPQRRWQMPESRLLWFHREAAAGSFAALNYFWNAPRSALISEEMEGLVCLRNLTPLKHKAHNRKKSKDNQARAALSLEPSLFLGWLFQEVVSVNILLNEFKSQGELTLIIWQLKLWSRFFPVTCQHK